MSSVYNDEMLKKSKKQSDVDNYNMIQGFKNDYIAAEKAGDTEGMKRANQNAEAVRATYGYSGGDSGDKYVQLNPVGNGNNSNSFFGNAYKDIGRMQNEGYNAYSDAINKQTKGMIESIGRNKNIVNENYNLAYEELNKSKEKTLEKLPEDMAKLGLYGSGTGETAYSKIQSGYAGELKKLLADKNKALTDIDNQIRDLENQSATQIAQYYAEMLQKNPELYLSMLNNQYNEFVNNRSYERGVFESDRAYDTEINMYSDQKARDEENAKLNRASLSASAGNYNPYVELGIITPEQAKFNENVYKSNLTPSSRGTVGSSSGNKEMLKSQVDTEISHWLYSPYNYDNTGYFYNGWNENTNPQYAARDKINNPEVVRYIKNELIGAGYTATQANNIIDGYKKTIAEQIAIIEGKDIEEKK